MLEKEIAYYKANKEKLRSQFAGKRVVIINDRVIGVYDTDGEAYEETIKTEPAGTFMIKYIPLNPADENLYIAPVIQPSAYA